MTEAKRSLLLRYSIAAVSVALAICVRRLLDPALGDDFPFATLFFAVTFSAWYGGFGPALTAVILGAFSAAYFLLPPRGSLAVEGWDQQAGLVLYLTVGIGIALLGGSMRLAQRRAEANALAERAQRDQLHVTLDSIGDAVIVTDAGGRVTLLNPAAQGLTGWRREDALGLRLENVFDIANEATGCAVESPVIKVMREGTVVGLANHTVLIAKDRTQRPIEDSGAPIKDGTGAITGVVLVFRDVSERKRTEEAVRQSEARKAAILEAALDAIITINHEGKIIEFNPAAEKTFGYSRSQVLGRAMAELIIPPPLREKHHRGLARYLATGEGPVLNQRIEMPALRADGSEFPVELAITRIATDGPPMFTAYVRDITDRKQAQAALRASEERFRTLVEQSVVGFYVIQDGRYIYVNPKLTDILGYSAAEMASRPVLDFIAEEDRPLVADNIRKRVEGTVESVRYRLRMCHRDGRVVHLEAHGSRSEHAGRPAILGVAIDVTDYMQAKETVERLAALVASSEDAIIGITPNGIVTDWNIGAERLFGYTAAEVTGQSVFLLVPSEDRQKADQILEKLRRGEAIQPYEAERMRKDGSNVVVSVRLSPIMHQNRLVGFSLIYRDLAPTKKLEEQLRQAQKMEAVGQLAGGVAHDFNNLLTVISGYSEMLLKSLRPGDTGRSLIEEIYKAGERAALLTRQLLAFSRKQVLEPKILDLNAIIAETEKMLRRLIGEDIALATSLAPDLGAVKVDPGQIEQVIINLAVNARDAMPQGGKLTFETANVELDEGYAQSHLEVKPGWYVMLAVSDTGIGMDEATKARIFEPFFTTKGPGKGTGLGLATVYGIIKQSGGHVAVYSEPGRGTTFKVYLPVVEERVPSVKHPGLRAALNGTETVLLVEDEPAVRSLSRLALQMYGYKVLEAGNGEEALRVSEQHQGAIHLLLTDVVMPGMSGRQVAEALRSRYSAVKVMFLSGYTDDAVVRHGILEAETAFLQKPFTPVALASKVREVLDG